MMKIRQAIRLLKREKEFLGVSWDKLFELCRAESSVVKLSTLDAYDAYERHWQDHQFLENMLEEKQ